MQKGHPCPRPCPRPQKKMYFKWKEYKCKEVTHTHAHAHRKKKYFKWKEYKCKEVTHAHAHAHRKKCTLSGRSISAKRSPTPTPTPTEKWKEYKCKKVNSESTEMGDSSWICRTDVRGKHRIEVLGSKYLFQKKVSLTINFISC